MTIMDDACAELRAAEQDLARAERAMVDHGYIRGPVKCCAEHYDAASAAYGRVLKARDAVLAIARRGDL